MIDTDTYAQQLVADAARFEAIETMIAHVMCSLYYKNGVTPEDLTEPHARLLQGFSVRTYDNVNPALADHYADEVKQGIERILSLAVQRLEDVQPK